MEVAPKDKEISELKRNLAIANRALKIYSEMFGGLQSAVNEVLTEMDEATKGGDPVTEGDRARFEFSKKIHRMMSDTIDKLAEALRGIRQ